MTPVHSTTGAQRLRTLLTLAWPVVLSRSAQAVVGFSDAVMTAPLGEGALTAVTAGAFNTLCLAALPMGLAFIIQSFASQLSGKGDHDAVRRFGWYGILISLFSGAVFLALIGAIDPVLSLLSFEDGVRSEMSDYMAIRFGAVAAIVGVEAVGNWYAGLGNTRYQMNASLATMVANVLLNWLLIEGHWGAPALGVQGAAIASVVSTFIGFIALLLLFWFRVGAPPYVRSRLRMSEFRRMLRFGLPNGLNWFLEFSAFMFFVDVVVADLGTVATGALLAVVQVNGLSFMPAFGISSAGAILVGQAIGADQRDRVPAILRTTTATAAVWQVSVSVLYVAFPAVIMGWFAPASAEGSLAEITTVGAVLLAWSAAWQLFDAIAMSLSEALRAAGDTTFCLWARITIAWALFVPGAYVAVSVFEQGPIAAVMAIIAYMAALGAVLWWRFRSGAWRSIELTEPDVVETPT